MLDKLLGRAELKARIEELEDENHHLERQLDAESDRRADAVSDKQAAEERINRLEDRITELEDRVERSQQREEHGREPRRTESLRGDRLDSVLDRLESVSTPRTPDESPIFAVDGCEPAAQGDASALGASSEERWYHVTSRFQRRGPHPVAEAVRGLLYTAMISPSATRWNDIRETLTDSPVGGRRLFAGS